MSQRRLRVAFAVLLAIGIIINTATLILFSRSLAGIRGNFCDWTVNQYAATRQLPQVPARIQAETSDVALMRQLGCPMKGVR